MKVLVTGCSGWVGAAVARELLTRGMQVVAPSRTPLAPKPGMQCVAMASLDGNTDFSDALTGVDVVVHLASRVHVMQDRAEDPLALYRTVNVQGTLNLARQAARAGSRRFVFVSSVKVNGEQTQDGAPFTEADAPQPQDPYGVSKWEAEQGLQAIAAASGMQCVVLRPPLVYGPGVKANFAALMRAVARGVPLPLGAIRNQRSLIALDNLVDVVALCITHPDAANQTFMVSDAQDLTTPELVRALARALDVAPRLIPIPVGLLMLAGRLLGKGTAVQRLCGNLQVSCAKAQRVLGWNPPLRLEQALQLATKGIKPQ